MIINKKGISAVVANVLIVLLVVASVAIIWAVVRPTIEQAGEGIEAGCFTVQVSPKSCALSASWSCFDDDDGTSTGEDCSVAEPGCAAGTTCRAGTVSSGIVSYRRRAGAGEIEKINLIFNKEDGTSEVIAIEDSSEFPEELGTIVSSFGESPLTSYGYELDEMDVAVVVGGNVCEPSGVPVSCSVTEEP